VVISKSDKDRCVFYCIYYGVESRNDYRLEPLVEKNAEGKIVSKRQRDIYYKKKNCLWLYYCSFKAVNKELKIRK
jgi:hypothetical protein